MTLKTVRDPILPSVPSKEEIKDPDRLQRWWKGLLTIIKEHVENVYDDLAALIPWDIDFTTPVNDVYRVKHNFLNFIANSGMESWMSGTTVPPDGWSIYGPSVARSAVAASGTYSAQVTYSANGQVFWASFGPFGRYGVYTYSVYYQRLSGSGIVALIAQLNESPYTELFSVDLDGTIDGVWKLAMLSFVVPESAWGKQSRLAFSSRDANASVWLFDEVQCQEGLNIATTWAPAPVWDTGVQGVFGKKWFFEDVKIAPWSKGVVMTNAAGTVTKRVRLNNAGDGLIYEAE